MVGGLDELGVVERVSEIVSEEATDAAHAYATAFSRSPDQIDQGVWLSWDW